MKVCQVHHIFCGQPQEQDRYTTVSEPLPNLLASLVAFAWQIQLVITFGNAQLIREPKRTRESDGSTCMSASSKDMMFGRSHRLHNPHEAVNLTL